MGSKKMTTSEAKAFAKAKAMVKTKEDADAVISTVANLLVRELKGTASTLPFLGKPEMVTLPSDPEQSRLEPRQAAAFFACLPHLAPAVSMMLEAAGLNSYKKGLGPLLEELAANDEFVRLMASTYGAKPVSRKELGEELYDYLCEHGEGFLAELWAEKSGKIVRLGNTNGVDFVLNHWFGSKAASELPDLGLFPNEVSDQLTRWMIETGYVDLL